MFNIFERIPRVLDKAEGNTLEMKADLHSHVVIRLLIYPELKKNRQFNIS